MKKQPNSAQGKVYRFKHRDVWSDDAKNDVQIPNVFLWHMVIVVGKSNTRRGWVKVATV